MAQPSVAVLRRFVRTREPEERCDLCREPLPKDHGHNFDPPSRRIRCACASCAFLYATVYRQIPRRVVALTQFEISDAQWANLMIPISLAFFSYSTPAAKMIALYPGPAGAAESLLRFDAWEEISAASSELRSMQPDVEALLANRVSAPHEYFLVPIDECYRLVGLIRLHWRGLSGGAAVWGEIGQFFNELRRKESVCRS